MVVSLPSQALSPVQSISQVPSLHWLAQSAGHSPEPGGSTAQASPPLSVSGPEEVVAGSTSVVADVGDIVVPSASTVVPADAEAVIAEVLLVAVDVVLDASTLPALVDPSDDALPEPLASKRHAESRRRIIDLRISSSIRERVDRGHIHLRGMQSWARRLSSARPR
jgi:hypothetical protein